MDFEIKVPTSKEEMEALRATLRTEISLDDLDAVVGGNDDQKGKANIAWTCPYCGQVVMCKQLQDASKHMVQSCPNNPYK